jgi:hypothetical protein
MSRRHRSIVSRFSLPHLTPVLQKFNELSTKPTKERLKFNVKLNQTEKLVSKPLVRIIFSGKQNKIKEEIKIETT